jgi:hypothetical protein
MANLKQYIPFIIVFSFLIFSTPALTQEKFMGIIKYEITNTRDDRRDTIICYYGENKTRTQRDHSLTLEYRGLSDLYYDFSTPEKASYSLLYYAEEQRVDTIFSKSDSEISPTTTFKDSTQIIIEKYSCSYGERNYITPPFQGNRSYIKEEFWYAKELPFPYPEWVKGNRLFGDNAKNCIALRVYKTVESMLPNGELYLGTSRTEAFEIIPCKLDDEIFEISIKK